MDAKSERVSLTKGMAIYLLVLFILLISFNARSQQQCTEITAAFGEDWFPVAFLAPESSDQLRGLAINILEKLAEEHDVTIKVQNPVPWKRAIRWLDNNQVDILGGHYWSKSRDNRWLVSKPMFYNDIRAFYLSYSEVNIDSLDSLSKYMGAYPAGASFGDTVDQFLQNNENSLSFKNNSSIISALLKKRVDYIVMAKEDGMAHLKKLQLTERVLMSDFSLAELTVHFSFSKSSSCKHLFQLFNNSLEKYTSTTQLERFINEATRQYFNLTQ